MPDYRELHEQYGHLTDEELMVALQKCDRDAHSMLYVRHSERLRSWASRNGVSPGDCEEPVQEAFLRVLKECARFNPARRFSPWLSRIFFNCLKDHFRRSRQAPDNVGHLIEGFYHDPTRSVVDAIYLSGCVDKLSEEDWEFYTEWKIEGQTLKELSESKGIPLTTLHTRLQRAETILKECLESKGGRIPKRSIASV
jgi:RNA polymerase sigma factor (sigma-70 family)